MEASHFSEFELPKGVEPFCWLSNEDLDRIYDIAHLAVKEAAEGLKMVEDERFRRYRIVHMLGMEGDWACGTLAGLRIQANRPETYPQKSKETI